MTLAGHSPSAAIPSCEMGTSQGHHLCSYVFVTLASFSALKGARFSPLRVTSHLTHSSQCHPPILILTKPSAAFAMIGRFLLLESFFSKFRATACSALSSHLPGQTSIHLATLALSLRFLLFPVRILPGGPHPAVALITKRPGLSSLLDPSHM